MLGVYIDVIVYLQLDPEFSLHDLEYSCCMLFLCECKAHLILIISFFTFSEANLVVLKYCVEFLSHVILEVVIVSCSNTLCEEVVL